MDDDDDDDDVCQKFDVCLFVCLSNCCCRRPFFRRNISLNKFVS